MIETGCDVLVVGGGVAGALAAAAAGRAGARTLLVEKESYLGGTGYTALLQHICGLYLNGADTPTDTLNGGLVSEVVSVLRRITPGTVIQRIGRVFVLPYDRAGLRSVLESFCSGQQHVTLMRESSVVSVEKKGERIETIIIEKKGTQTRLSPCVVIDASGNGSAAAAAGNRFELTPVQERQLAGYIVHISGLTNADDALPLKVPYVLSHAANSGTVPYSARFTTFSFGRSPEEGYCKLSISEEESAERDEKAKQQAELILGVLKNALPAFRNSEIDDSSLKVADREGRRILGEYVLTREDVLGARKFPDGVVKNAWPIELWHKDKGTVYEYVSDGDYYEIPFRCLTVKGVSNMLAAGRCISVTHEALGSTRVMGACMALGEQAGKAAAYRVKQGTWPRDFKE